MRQVPSRCNPEVCSVIGARADALRACGLQNLDRAILQEARIGEVVGVILVGDSHARACPRRPSASGSS